MTKCIILGCDEQVNDPLQHYCTFHEAVAEQAGKPVLSPQFPEETDNPYWEPARAPVFDEIQHDLSARNEKGWSEHSKPLLPDDGRDWLQEAYEEALDLCVYLKAEIMRRGRVK